MALKDLHLADLHERARELDVPGFRMLSREELVEAIEAGGEEKPKRGRGRSKRKDEEPKKEEKERKTPERPPEETETEDVIGVLDRMPQGYGFLRLGGFEPHEGDVYISASQIRRCELRPGDAVGGPARAPREGERHRALVRVVAVNGGEPEEKRKQFENLPTTTPERALSDPDVLFGQRVLMLSGPDSKYADRLRDIAKAAADAKAHLTVVLTGDAAGDAKKWEKVAKDAEMFVASEESEPRDRARAAELAVARAKRRAETGGDVLVVIDSLSNLALGYRQASRVKRLLEAGRELDGEGRGSVTVIATIIDGDERADDVRDALEGTEDVLLEAD